MKGMQLVGQCLSLGQGEAAQIYVVGPLGDHRAFDFDDAAASFGDRTQTDAARVITR